MTKVLYHHHWRLLTGTGCGLVGFFIFSNYGVPPGLSRLMGWNIGCIIFLGLVVPLLFESEQKVRMRASMEDEGAQIMTLLVTCAAAASLAAIVLTLKESKAGAAHASGGGLWPLALSISTLAMGWLVIQAIFALRYAHSYFGDTDHDGAINGGVTFPGEEPHRYSDFIYMAVCVGCTSQVSDFNITTSDFRNLVTTHAIISFTYNISVLALGINMAASLLGV